MLSSSVPLFVSIMKNPKPGELLQDELQVFIEDVRRTIEQAAVVRSFANSDLLTQQAAAEELEAMAKKLSERARTVAGLIDDFVNSPDSDLSIADKARNLMANTTEDIRRFYREALHPDVQDLGDGVGAGH